MQKWIDGNHFHGIRNNFSVENTVESGFLETKYYKFLKKLAQVRSKTTIPHKIVFMVEFLVKLLILNFLSSKNILRSIT